MSYLAGLQEIVVGKNLKAGKEGTTHDIYFPTLEEVVANIQTDSVLGETLRTSLTNGLKQLTRNHVTGGYPDPSTLDQLVANEAARELASKDKGEALKVRRAAIQSFIDFATAAGVPAAATAKMSGWLNSKDMNALAAQKEATRNNIGKLAAAWCEQLPENSGYDKVVATLSTALDGEQVEADDFAF